eukprot:GHVL01005200.1.p1 GENE.GHVL01005200.1~~GHVL01005200.1.p1  ORF type:complete len:294 (-),score=38.17 GHVL01005200.1:2042-2923(-)
MYTPDENNPKDVYIVTDLMETDLRRIIRSSQALNDDHVMVLMYQLLLGLSYLKSAGIMHRDLTSSNVLVNSHCDLKICDLGLGRGVEEQQEDEDIYTDYVVARWYRAPEIVLDACHYTFAIDMWSAGCILCELLGRKPLFEGENTLDQVSEIIKILGTPSDADLEWLPKDGPARVFLKAIMRHSNPQIDWSVMYPEANPKVLDLVSKMLTFNPNVRITAEEAIEHPYFDEVRSVEDVRCSDNQIDWSFDRFQLKRENIASRFDVELKKFNGYRNKTTVNLNSSNANIDLNEAI